MSARAFLGPLIVLSAALLSVVFTGAESFKFGLGYTVGKLFISVAFALPIFIVVKYATRYGRRLQTQEGLNLFCYLLVACWALQLLLGLTVPAYMERLLYDQSQSNAQQPAGDKRPWERDWSQGRSEHSAAPHASKSPEILPLESRDKISGKARITRDGTLVGTSHNGNADWTISELIINVSEPDWFLRAVRAREQGLPEPKLQKYRVSLHLLPHSSAEILIPVHWPIADKYEWNIYEAVGTRE